MNKKGSLVPREPSIDLLSNFLYKLKFNNHRVIKEIPYVQMCNFHDYQD